VLEALASRTAIFNRIKAGIKDGQKTLLTEMLGDDLSDLRSGDLRKAIRRGDKFVDKIVEEASEYIGIAVANLMNILNPDVIVLGGGVIEALGDEMMGVIVETAREYALSGTNKDVEIVASELGDSAGITGGAVLARQEAK
jgi:glucokinase